MTDFEWIPSKKKFVKDLNNEPKRIFLKVNFELNSMNLKLSEKNKLNFCFLKCLTFTFYLL